jgi:hypothetical protein
LKREKITLEFPCAIPCNTAILAWEQPSQRFVAFPAMRPGLARKIPPALSNRKTIKGAEPTDAEGAPRLYLNKPQCP